MGLVYDACKGGPGAGGEARPGDVEEPAVNTDPTLRDIDSVAPVSRSDGIRDLFPEMEATCRLQDGVVDDEFAEESLFGRILSGALGPVGRERLLAVAYGGVLIVLFAGAFIAGVRLLAVDWDTPIELTYTSTGANRPSVSNILAAPIETSTPTAEPSAVVAPVARPVATPRITRIAPAESEPELAEVPSARSVAPRPRGGATVTVDGIVRWTGAKPIAIVNGATVEPGDVVDGYTVMAIDAQGVLLLAGGELFYVPLKETATLPA